MTKLQDVARRAGVSTSTVSRAISRPELVNARTRARVEAAIRELGFRPSRVARRLRVERGSTSLLGLVIPDLQNPFFADLARGVEDAAARHGYTVLLGNADEDPDKERRYLEVMRSESVDGVILPPCSERDPSALDLLGGGIPVVCVDRRLRGGRVDTVVVDNVRAAQAATEHLLALGHRRIAFLEGNPRLSTSRERLQGYRAALAEHGIEPDPAWVRAGDGRQGSGRLHAAELLSVDPRPTALLVANGMMTLGALEGIHAAGVRIPDEVSVVGFDDMPWALALTPPLTVVRQPSYELGERALELLLQRIRDPERSTTTMLLEAEVIVRGSTAAPPPG